MARGKYLGPLDDGPIFPRDVPDGLLRAAAQEAGEADAVERALIRLLWRSVADGDEKCYGNSSAPDPCGDGDPAELDLCQAMRALGWGEHWDPEVFQRRASPSLPSESK